MIDKDDLRASVGAGILNERQAAALSSLADSRRGVRETLAPTDEPFELFRGFNEVFIMVGLAILAAGWFGVVSLGLLADPANLQFTVLLATGFSAAVIWVLSEYFIRRRRMVGPAIMLSILFGGSCAFGLTQYFAQPFMLAQEDFSSLQLPGILAVAALLLFWARFRVPFAMALIALSLFVVALLFAAVRSGTPQSLSDVFLLSGEGAFAWITLGLGLAIFAAAMAFDASDPHRVTLRSRQGFWLHVVAAPAIVNTVSVTFLSMETVGANGLMIAFLAVIAVVAIVIDRRSFLMTAIGYTVILSLTALEGEGIFSLVLALGVFMVLLGAFWERIRGAIMRYLPLGGARRFLPPSF